jgi:hypothetical protein
MKLYDAKYNFREAAGGLWIDEFTLEEDAIKEALARGDAVVIEVDAGTEATTIHTLPVEDMERFGSLAAWSAWTCSGREAAFDSVFYRVDREPVETSRESLREGVTSQPNLATGNKAKPAPAPGDDDEEGDGGDDGDAGGPVKARPGPGEEPPPPPAQIRAPRSR